MIKDQDKEYLSKRLHMIEKTLTKACTVLVEQKEQIESLQLRVGKLEECQMQLLEFINDLQGVVAKVESKADSLDSRTRGSIRYGI